MKNRVPENPGTRSFGVAVGPAGRLPWRECRLGEFDVLQGSAIERAAIRADRSDGWLREINIFERSFAAQLSGWLFLGTAGCQETAGKCRNGQDSPRCHPSVSWSSVTALRPERCQPGRRPG